MATDEVIPFHYQVPVDEIRVREYPLLKDTTYLDHAGTTLYANSLIKAFSQELTSNLFGNPHSASSSSQSSTRRIDDARVQVLRFFNANPEHFDVVFVANATAGIKLVAESIRDYNPAGFWYGYHVDSHTSLVGVREMAEQGKRCFLNDQDVVEWLELLKWGDSASKPAGPVLFAYPGQSNMTGRRLPLSWCKEINCCLDTNGNRRAFTLFDAASLASTSPLDLGDIECAPDFTVVSFYKIFGFPDLGALIIRKDAGHLLQNRKYFGGGTVGMVLTIGEQWHAKKATALHEQLEDGTLPFHNIIALQCAFDTHERLYGSMRNISRHTSYMAENLYNRLSTLEHRNRTKVCEIYKGPGKYTESSLQGPIISLNLRNSTGEWVRKSEVEKLAAVKNIQIRSGTLCNPGGMAYYLGLKAEDMRRNFDAGQRCGDDNDIIAGKPTGGLRVSLGAMTSMQDIDTFVDFIRDFYVDQSIVNGRRTLGSLTPSIQLQHSRFYIEKLCVYPLKSCGAFVIPESTAWEVRPEGLAWDREWCLIHQGTGMALSQKRYPKMALIRPIIDLKSGVLRIIIPGRGSCQDTIEIPLSSGSMGMSPGKLCQYSRDQQSTVCGDTITVQVYKSPRISSFFSDFLNVPCNLARFPSQNNCSARFSKPYSRPKKRQEPSMPAIPSPQLPGSFPEPTAPGSKRPILLSNEGPVLLISRASVNKVNEAIKSSGKPLSTSKTVSADVFRANIIVADTKSTPPSLSGAYASSEKAYLEETWSGFQTENSLFDTLGSCQRCQMICIDQATAKRSDEPYSTLARTRKIDGRVYFGRHACLSGTRDGQKATVRVGDRVTPSYD